MILKLILPFLIFFIIGLARIYLTKVLPSKQNKRSEQMLSCSACGTFVHESLVVKKRGDSFCSEDCSMS